MTINKSQRPNLGIPSGWLAFTWKVSVSRMDNFTRLPPKFKVANHLQIFSQEKENNNGYPLIIKYSPAGCERCTM